MGKNCVVYINWDGFAWYYFEYANRNGKAGTAVLNGLAEKGVLFKNARTGVPAITNPMQTAIVSGAWPVTTGNCYRYYDRAKNRVVATGRLNKAENIAEAAVRQGLKVASIHQFILENKGTYAGDADKPYISLGDNSDYCMRFDAAIKLIKGEEVGTGNGKVKLGQLPQFIALYMDDLDGIGHNMAETYGVKPVKTENERLESVEKRLLKMDKKLGEFIDACIDEGIYEDMTFVLTTDHGMTPYGQQSEEADQYGKSCIFDLKESMDSMSLKMAYLDEGMSAPKDADIVVVSAGLGLQLTFLSSKANGSIDKFEEMLKSKPYTGQIMKRDELTERFAMKDFADMYVSPKVPYNFKPWNRTYQALGQHDSLDESSQHIFSLMWGRGVKSGYTYEEKIYNIDFAPTMAKLLGIDPPRNSTAKILCSALK